MGKNQKKDNDNKKKVGINNDQLGENMTEFSEDVNPNNVQRRRENDKKNNR